MRLEQDSRGRLKTWIHIGCAALLTVAFFLSLVLLTQKGEADVRTAYFFALCFVTVPILIYQTMVPMWSRAIRFSNVYAFAIFDAGFALLWFTAWAALAAYVGMGKQVAGKGTKIDTTWNPNAGKGGCDGFIFGTPLKCNISTANIFFGLAIMCTFVATGYLSLSTLMEYRRSGITSSSGGPLRANSRKSFASTRSIKSTKRRNTMNSIGVGTLGGLKSTRSFLGPEKDYESGLDDDYWYGPDEDGNPPPEMPRGIAGYASLGQSG